MNDLPDDLLDASAVIVTRGDVDLTDIIASLSMFGEIVTWNNGGGYITISNIDGVSRVPATIGWGEGQTEPRDLAVYGRYAAMRHCRYQTTYVQDDDCIVSADGIKALIDTFAAGDRTGLVVNIPPQFEPHYPDSGLVGFGAVMDTDFPEKVFARFLDAIGDQAFDEGMFLRRCDNILTTLAPLVRISCDYTDLPWASVGGRMWTTPGHAAERDETIRIARAVRDALARA